MVQIHCAGEQKLHWDEINKENYHFKLCISFVCLVPFATFVLRLGGFVSREWLAAKGLFRNHTAAIIIGNNSRHQNSIFHSNFRMWRGRGVYCRLTGQWSYLHSWFLKKNFLQIHFSHYSVFKVSLHFFSLSASSPHAPITSSGDNFKYRGPQVDFSICFHY